ncbi:hypothetical protein HMI54_005688, partial [Coelomomyces lativittatus]
PEIYRQIIQKVIDDARQDFVLNGIDEVYLEELRITWEKKLFGSGVADFGTIEPEEDDYFVNPHPISTYSILPESDYRRPSFASPPAPPPTSITSHVRSDSPVPYPFNPSSLPSASSNNYPYLGREGRPVTYMPPPKKPQLPLPPPPTLPGIFSTTYSTLEPSIPSFPTPPPPPPFSTSLHPSFSSIPLSSSSNPKFASPPPHATPTTATTTATTSSSSSSSSSSPSPSVRPTTLPQYDGPSSFASPSSTTTPTASPSLQGRSTPPRRSDVPSKPTPPSSSSSSVSASSTSTSSMRSQASHAESMKDTYLRPPPPLELRGGSSEPEELNSELDDSEDEDDHDTPMDASNMVLCLYEK